MLLVWIAAATASHADEPATAPSMTLTHSFILGIIEGVTEYLPVSSTGHLIVVQRLMGIGQTEADHRAADAYSICIQAGAILAVLGLYFGYVRRMIRGLLGRDPAGLHLLTHIMVAFLPAAVIGLLFHRYIKMYLFGLWPIVSAWFVGGVAILAVSFWRRGKPPLTGLALDALTWRKALFIGFLQCIAMWPGVSRSLITIVGGVLVGMNLPNAVIFSFLVGVVTLTAATLHEAMAHGRLMLEVFGPANLLVGFAAATISAMIAVKWLVTYLKRHGLWLFGYYRIAIAVAVALLILKGVLSDSA